MIDAVGDGVGEQTNQETPSDEPRVVPRRAALCDAEWRERDGTEAEPDGEPGDAAVVLRDSCAQHDVARPAHGCKKDEQQPERFVVDLDARKHDDAQCRERQGSGVAARPSGECGDGDRPDEFDRHTFAEMQSVDRHVEGEVHERGDDAERGRAAQLRAGEPAAPTKLPEREQREPERRADHPQPCRRCGRQLGEEPHGNHRADVLADSRDDEQRLGWRCLERVASLLQSKRSGSVRQISCHNGWKLSQPATSCAVRSRV